MDQNSQDEMMRVGRAIVADIAPGELVLFKMHSEEFFRDPDNALATPKVREDALGFGAGEMAGLMTPFVLMGIKTVVSCVAQDLGRELGAQTRAGVRHLVQRLFGPPAVDSIILTEAQLQQVRSAVIASIGVDQTASQGVADSIVKALRAAASPPAATV